jgi:hypothetical protein
MAGRAMMRLNAEQARVVRLMRECRHDFMHAARDLRSQRRPAGWIRAQVRMARHANRLLVECLREAREVRP